MHELIFIFALLVLVVQAANAQTPTSQPASQPATDPRFSIGDVIAKDDFTNLDSWQGELEKPGKVEAKNGVLTIDVPAGCSVWYKPKLTGPIMISYTAKVIKNGGANDRVSDLNCFWMASNATDDPNPLSHPRTGKFADYNNLLTYYVGMGGNANTTTRFRRYIGDNVNRPLLPEHDLKDAPHLLKANHEYRITLVACDHLVQFIVDGEKVFEITDEHPYTAGWFAFRTVTNHMEISRFQVNRLVCNFH